MGNIIKFNFIQCRATRRELWDYAGERLAEGPLERVERHLERCAACRKEAQDFKRAQSLLATAPMDTPRTARPGWNDLQRRIAADVAAFGPPRPDKNSTRRVVSQLVRPRRPFMLTAWRPTLASGVALTLALSLFARHALKTHPTPSPSVFTGATASITTPVAPVAAGRIGDISDLLAQSGDKFPPVMSVESNAPAAKAAAAKTVAAPRRAMKVIAHYAHPQTAKIASSHAPNKIKMASGPQDTSDDNKIQFKQNNLAAAEKAPDASEVTHGVIGALVPVSHDEDNVYY